MEDTKLEEIMDEEEEFAEAPQDQHVEKIDYSAQFAQNTDSFRTHHISESNSITSTVPSSQIPQQQQQQQRQEVEESESRRQQQKKTEIRALNGEIVDDEFLADAINYEFLMEKIDLLLDKLKLDA